MNEREKCYSELVGGAIRDLRQNLHKSVRLFAYENDIPQATLSRVERGDGVAAHAVLARDVYSAQQPVVVDCETWYLFQLCKLRIKS